MRTSLRTFAHFGTRSSRRCTFSQRPKVNPSSWGGRASRSSFSHSTLSDTAELGRIVEMAQSGKLVGSQAPTPTDLDAMDISKYDLVGFDLDHTLATYNLKNLFTNHFNYLVKLLNTSKGYTVDPELTPAMVDFMSRGLIIDIDKGNLLKVSCDGEIVRASHGTRALEPSEIVKVYGPKRQWKTLKDVMTKKFLNWKARSDELYSFMDFTDAAVTAVYALAVDSGKKERQVWLDVIEAVRGMYSDEAWSNDLFHNSEQYINKTPDKVLEWISQMRLHNIKTALITSNWYEFVPRIADSSIGSNWHSLFDFCVFNAKKPGFFLKRSPFLDVAGKEVEFTLSGDYCRGSMRGVQEALAKELNREPNCLYVGDSPLHDFLFTSVDYIAVVEELKAEGLMGGHHPSADFLASSFWGSYLYEGDKLTLFGKIAFEGKLFVPDLEFLAEQPIDHAFVKSLPKQTPEEN